MLYQERQHQILRNHLRPRWQNFWASTDEPPKKQARATDVFRPRHLYGTILFIPSLITLTTPLRELIKQNNSFTWSATHQDVLDKIKESISDEITLTYFDLQKETVLQVKASSKGLGAVLLVTRRWTCRFCKQSPWRCGVKIRKHWAGIVSHGVWLRKIPYIFFLGDNSLSIQTISLWKAYNT